MSTILKTAVIVLTGVLTYGVIWGIINDYKSFKKGKRGKKTKEPNC
jgi:regulatory protein YycH of two-component signal transduction system YycFG